MIRATFGLIPLLAAAATAAGVAYAPAAGADCNTVTGSTLCASGTVTGSSGAPTSIPVPAYTPYPCLGSPGCDYYDNYNPGNIFDRPLQPQPR